MINDINKYIKIRILLYISDKSSFAPYKEIFNIKDIKLFKKNIHI